MIKIDDNAWKTLWRLFKAQALVLVPLLALAAVAVMFASGEKTDPIGVLTHFLFAAIGIPAAFAFGYWAIGMGFDLLVLLLKLILQSFIFLFFAVRRALVLCLCRYHGQQPRRLE